MDVMATIRGLKRRVLDVSGAGYPRGVWLLSLYASDPPAQPIPLRGRLMMQKPFARALDARPAGSSSCQLSPCAARTVKVVRRWGVSTCDRSPLRDCLKSITSFPTNPMKFKVKYPLWVVESPSAEDAKKQIADFYQSGGLRFITVELLEQRPLWKRLLWGH